MKKYKCEVCGYIYDPETGDPDRGVAPTTLSSPGLHLKTYPKTGFARFAESAKNSL